MVLYLPLGYVTEKWTYAGCEARVADCSLLSSSFYAVMGNAVWPVGLAGEIPGVGGIVAGYSGDPDLAIVQQVGAGAWHDLSWWIWRTISWPSRDLWLPPLAIAALQDRAVFLRRAIRLWYEAQAAHPGAAMRTGIGLWEAELVEIEGRVFSTGGLQLVVYVGYAWRWSANSYVLPRSWGWESEEPEPEERREPRDWKSRQFHFIGVTGKALCGLQREIGELCSSVSDWWDIPEAARCGKCSSILISSERGP
jgi:hypothetical protein